MDAVALKVKIGLRPNGHADHPDWKQLPMMAGVEDKDNEKFFIHGWVYDKTSGHGDDTPGSDASMQWGVVLVTPAFAAEAVVAFPDTISVLTEVQLKMFWEERGTAHLSGRRIDVGVLQGLRAEREMKVSMGRDIKGVEEEISKAIDPDDATPGIRRNPNKKWNDVKARMGITIVGLP